MNFGINVTKNLTFNHTSELKKIWVSGVDLGLGLKPKTHTHKPIKFGFQNQTHTHKPIPKPEQKETRSAFLCDYVNSYCN